MLPVAWCAGLLGTWVVVVLVIGAAMFVITAVGVTWQRFLERRLFKVSVDRAIYNPLLMGVVAALFAMAFFGGLIILLGLTEPNSCG